MNKPVFLFLFFFTCPRMLRSRSQKSGWQYSLGLEAGRQGDGKHSVEMADMDPG